jgi:hypothetical protein
MNQSYHLFITRRPKNGPDITLTEWLDYVGKDSELARTRGSSAPVVWSGAPDRCLAWHHGEIIADDPDFLLMDKMLKIAQALQAVVQGDDLEIYDA